MLLLERILSWHRCFFGNHPQDTEPFQRATQAILDEQFSDVLMLLEPVLRRNPRNVYALVMRSHAYRMMGDMDAAWQDANLAVERAPANVNAVSHRGHLARVLSKLDQAKADYEKAILIQPKDGGGHFDLARCLYEQGQFQQSVLEYRKAMSLGVDTWECWEEMGNSHLELGEWGNALSSCDAALYRNPDAIWSMRGRGTALTFLGRFSEAIVEFHRFLTQVPDDLLALNNRSYCHLKLQDWASAKADLDKIFAINLKYAPAWKNLAILQNQSIDSSFRDPHQAVKSATRAMELTDWEMSQCLPVLADAYESAGDHTKAAEYRSKVNHT